MKRKRCANVFLAISLAYILLGTSIPIGQDSEEPQAKLPLATALDNLEDRLKSIEQALARKFFELGQSALARGDLILAKNDFEQAVSLDPEFDEARKFFSVVQEKLNNFRQKSRRK